VSVGQDVTEPSVDSSPTADGSPEPCLSCGEQAMNAYCAVCGERRRAEADYSLRRFIAHAIQMVTNLDSTAGRSFACLFLWPGHLTAEHFVGRRRPYLNPLKLFLISNVFFFAIISIGSSGGGPFTTTLSDQLRHHPYSSALHGVSTGAGVTFGELLDDPLAFRSYAQTYNTMTHMLAKSLVIVMVPIWALLSWLLYGRSARFYAQHLVFSLHVWGYILLLVCLVGLAMSSVQMFAAHLGARFGWQLWDLVLSLLLVSMLVVYLSEAGQRAFGQRLRWTVPKAVILSLSLLPIIWLYRLILFFATVAAV